MLKRSSSTLGTEGSNLAVFFNAMLSVTRKASVPSHQSRWPPLLMMEIKKKKIKINTISLWSVEWFNNPVRFNLCSIICLWLCCKRMASTCTYRSWPSLLSTYRLQFASLLFASSLNLAVRSIAPGISLWAFPTPAGNITQQSLG